MRCADRRSGRCGAPRTAGRASPARWPGPATGHRRPGSGTSGWGCGSVPDPIGSEQIRRIAEAALELPGADGVEVLAVHDWGGLTRFADSAIHQSTAREDTAVKVRVVAGGRLGVASTNDLTKEGAAGAARSALELAEMAAPDPVFPGLAPRAEVAEPADRFDVDTASTTPRARAEGVAALIGTLGEGFHAAGAHETVASEVAVATTEGQFCYAATSQATASTVVSGGDGGTGYAEAWGGPRVRGGRHGRRARPPQRQAGGSSLDRARPPAAEPPRPLPPEPVPGAG